MSLQEQVMEKIKEAMKAKDSEALEPLRAIKAEILLARTRTNSNEELSEEEEIKMLQKLVKQRKESASLYQEKDREDLAKPELFQASIIASFLPKQLDEQAVKTIIKTIIEANNASSIKDMGKVMGLASKELAGKSDGKMISNIVKELLT
jgi:uncharacterized protein YqeY